MSFTNINNCDFYTNEICKERLRKIYEDDIPETNKNIVTIGMFLCQTHYNQLILSESLRIKKTKTYQHPKYRVYLNEANTTDTLTILNEISLNNKIRKMSNILYNNQHKLNQKPIYNPIVFKIILEIADKDLIRFFNELYIRINPDTKSNKTNKSNKKKLVSLYYFLASINNKYINSIKANIGSYLQTSGASSSSIDTLANIGISVTRKIVNRQKINISNEYEQSVDDYCLKNIEKMFILNIDDYHNIHHHNIPSLLETHNILHFITILLNSNSNISRIPYCSNNILLHNPKEIDSNLIIKNLEDYFMNQIGKNYYEQNELWK